MEYKTAETNQDREIKEQGDAAANSNISSSASDQLCCLLRVLEKKKKEREKHKSSKEKRNVENNVIPSRGCSSLRFLLLESKSKHVVKQFLL